VPAASIDSGPVSQPDSRNDAATAENTVSRKISVSVMRKMRASPSRDSDSCWKSRLPCSTASAFSDSAVGTGCTSCR